MPLRGKTSVGVAMVFSGDPETCECSCDTFTEGEYGCTDPIRSAEALRDSCEADFPGRMWSITGNERAREIMADRRMREWGIA